MSRLMEKGVQTMRILTMAALVAAQLLAAAQPARAAEFEPSAGQRMGAFGGVRVRLPLDGHSPTAGCGPVSPLRRRCTAGPWMENRGCGSARAWSSACADTSRCG